MHYRLADAHIRHLSGIYSYVAVAGGLYTGVAYTEALLLVELVYRLGLCIRLDEVNRLVVKGVQHLLRGDDLEADLFYLCLPHYEVGVALEVYNALVVEVARGDVFKPAGGL